MILPRTRGTLRVFGKRLSREEVAVDLSDSPLWHAGAGPKIARSSVSGTR